MNVQLVIGVAIVVIFIVTFIAVGYLAWRNGVLITQKETTDRDLEAAKRVSQASTDAPSNRDELIERLLNDKRGL